MEKIIQKYISDLEKRNRIEFKTSKEEITKRYNDCHPYYSEGAKIKYYLEDLNYGNYTVECCIAPSFYFSAVQSNGTMNNYARVYIKIKDNKTGECIMHCSYSKGEGGSRNGITQAAVTCSEEKGEDKARGYCYSEGIGVAEDAVHPVTVAIRNNKPSLQIKVPKVDERTNKPYLGWEDVSAQTFDEYTKGMPTPEQIKQVVKLIRQKTVFREVETGYVVKSNTIIRESTCWEQQHTGTDLSPKRVAEALNGLQESEKVFQETGEHIQE